MGSRWPSGVRTIVLGLATSLGSMQADRRVKRLGGGGLDISEISDEVTVESGADTTRMVGVNRSRLGGIGRGAESDSVGIGGVGMLGGSMVGRATGSAMAISASSMAEELFDVVSALRPFRALLSQPQAIKNEGQLALLSCTNKTPEDRLVAAGGKESYRGRARRGWAMSVGQPSALKDEM